MARALTLLAAVLPVLTIPFMLGGVASANAVKPVRRDQFQFDLLPWRRPGGFHPGWQNGLRARGQRRCWKIVGLPFNQSYGNAAVADFRAMNFAVPAAARRMFGGSPLLFRARCRWRRFKSAAIGVGTAACGCRKLNAICTLIIWQSFFRR
jgi:hypothetical protein